MLNSAEHENFSANKYKNTDDRFSCSAMLNQKEFAIVSNLRYISRTNEKSFISSGLGFSLI